GLNCAAARQEVPDVRDIVSRLYGWLDTRSGSPPSVAVAARAEMELTTCFRRESVQLMEQIEQGAGSLLQEGVLLSGRGEGVCADLLSWLHTLKGNALQFDCHDLAALCHGFERLLLGA